VCQKNRRKKPREETTERGTGGHRFEGWVMGWYGVEYAIVIPYPENYSIPGYKI
jgi:hypothetical protein